MATSILGLCPVLVDGLGGGEMSESKMREALEEMRAVVVQRNCGGMEWGDQFDDIMTALGMADEALAQQPAAVVELTDSELEAGRHQVFSTNNPFCPCDSKTFRKAARWAIAAHIAKQSGDAA